MYFYLKQGRNEYEIFLDFCPLISSAACLRRVREGIVLKQKTLSILFVFFWNYSQNFFVCSSRRKERTDLSLIGVNGGTVTSGVGVKSVDP